MDQTAAYTTVLFVQVHAANKPIDRSDGDQVLRRIAELAVGYSGAELANLLNEAAILAVSTSQLTCHSSRRLCCIHRYFTVGHSVLSKLLGLGR